MNNDWRAVMSDKIENLKHRLLDLEAPAAAADWQLETLNPLTNDILDAFDRIKAGAFDALPYFLDLQAKAIAEAEIDIVRTLVIDVLIAGHSISVAIGGSREGVIRCSRDLYAIMAFLDDERRRGCSNPRLCIHEGKGAQVGWIQFKTRSQGWDVMAEHSPRVEPLMAGAQALAEQYAKKFLMED